MRLMVAHEYLYKFQRSSQGDGFPLTPQSSFESLYLIQIDQILQAIELVRIG